MRALAVLVLASCSNILGIDDVRLRDAGGGGPDTGPPPNTVIGRSFTRHNTPAGMMEVPTDLSQVVVQALIVDPAQPAGYRVSVGTGRTDGTFTIPDVPDGAPFLLKLNTSYFATTLHDLDRHFEFPLRGAPKPAELSAPTMVDFNVTNMTPFVNGPEGVFSRIEINSLNVGYQGQVFLDNNATALATSYDWENGFSIVSTAIPLPDATQGDDLTMLHLRDDRVPGGFGRKQVVTRVIDTFMPSGVTIANGATTNVAGSWTPATVNRSINLSVTRGLFDNAYDGTSQVQGMFVSLHAHPVFNDFDFWSTVFVAHFIDWSRSASLGEAVGFMYADPYPASWSRILVVDYQRFRWVRLPNTTTPTAIFASNVRALAYTGGNPITNPVVQAPANIKVNGKDAGAGGLINFDGTAPVEMTWNAVAAAEQYFVRVDRVFPNGSQTRRSSAAGLTTAQTSIKIPAEVFSGGEFFAFTVMAVQSPADYSAGQLIPNGTPHNLASAPGGLFRLSSRCGDGNVDPGEECDAAGENAMCDVDCTARLCGDGLRNAAAGEACDTIRDTSGCDADCTLPACGDNYVNTIVEDCDDGNNTDQGNGCSTACKLNNVCGNGTVQPIAEQCDPGGAGETSACDNDCTVVECGDGHRNPVASEQCDDGNQQPGDGCSSTCQVR
jgi:cysteine-rich repeat protein